MFNYLAYCKIDSLNFIYTRCQHLPILLLSFQSRYFIFLAKLPRIESLNTSLNRSEENRLPGLVLDPIGRKLSFFHR